MPTEDDNPNAAVDTKRNRSITIEVAPEVLWFAVAPPIAKATTVSFKLVASDPPGNATVNETTGQIDISHLPDAPGYSDNIDITLMLDTAKMRDLDGQPFAEGHRPRWAKDGEGLLCMDSNGRYRRTGSGWFCLTSEVSGSVGYMPVTPTEIDKMTFERKDDTTLVIKDDTEDHSPPYAFMVGITLPDTHLYVPIDPVITSKRTTNNV